MAVAPAEPPQNGGRERGDYDEWFRSHLAQSSVGTNLHSAERTESIRLLRQELGLTEHREIGSKEDRLKMLNEEEELESALDALGNIDLSDVEMKELYLAAKSINEETGGTRNLRRASVVAELLSGIKPKSDLMAIVELPELMKRKEKKARKKERKKMKEEERRRYHKRMEMERKLGKGNKPGQAPLSAGKKLTRRGSIVASLLDSDDSDGPAGLTDAAIKAKSRKSSGRSRARDLIPPSSSSEDSSDDSDEAESPGVVDEQTYEINSDLLPELTPELEREFKETFELFVEAGDDEISTELLSEVMSELGQDTNTEQLRKFIDEVDVDGSGTIDFKEFCYMMLKMLAGRNDRKEVAEQFLILDRDRDGYLTLKDLKKMSRRVDKDGTRLTDEELWEMIRMADYDLDGKWKSDEEISKGDKASDLAASQNSLNKVGPKNEDEGQPMVMSSAASEGQTHGAAVTTTAVAGGDYSNKRDITEVETPSTKVQVNGPHVANGGPAQDAEKAALAGKASTSEPQESQKGCCTFMCASCLTLGKGWRLYTRQSVVFAGLGLASLYMTVLGFDNITVGYAKIQGMSEAVLGAFMGMGAFLGIIGTFIYPRVRRKVGIERTGLIGFNLEVLCLTLCVASIWAPGSPFDPFFLRPAPTEICPLTSMQTEPTTTTADDQMSYTPLLQDGPSNLSLLVETIGTQVSSDAASAAPNLTQVFSTLVTAAPNVTGGSNCTDVLETWYTMPTSMMSLALLLAGIISARLGLWMADLTVSQLLIEQVNELHRGTVNGVQNSLNMLMDLIKFVLVFLLPDPRQFGLLIMLSFLFVAMGSLSYACGYSRRVRGHLFHFEKVGGVMMQCQCAGMANGTANQNNANNRAEKPQYYMQHPASHPCT